MVQTIKVPLWDDADTTSVVGIRKDGTTALELSLRGDPTAWTKDGYNPALDLGTGWETTVVGTPSVLYSESEKLYRMWYMGYLSPSYKIGLAYSGDGRFFKRYTSNPVLSPGAGGTWDDVSVGYPHVILDGSTYKMYYSGYDGSNFQIGLATSSDGISWTKEATNPVVALGGGGAWDSTEAYNPTVLKDGATYKMWYSGYNGSTRHIGYATSSDGVSWTKYVSNPVLSPGAGGTWDASGLYGASVLKREDGTYEMLYSGYDGTNFRIGYATSSDGVSWTKYGSNPVLNIGAGGTWDDVRVLHHKASFRDGEYKLWYSGHDGTTYRIGLAVANYPTSSPSPGQAWAAIPVGSVIDMSSIKIPETMNDGDAGSVKYKYATNNGSLNATWLTLAQLQAESDPTITNATNSFKIVPQYTSTGTQKTTSQAFAIVDVTLAAGGSLLVHPGMSGGMRG